MPVVTLRLTDDQHRVIRVAAATKGQSLQVWIGRACADVAGQQAAEGDHALRSAIRQAGMLDDAPKTAARKAGTLGGRARKGSGR